MNEQIYKAKRNPLLQKNNQISQKITYVQPHVYCLGGPKNPPNISQYYHQLGNATKKKEGMSRQAKYKDNRQIIKQRNPIQLRNSNCGLGKQRNNSRIISQNTAQKFSNIKKEKKTQLKLKKNPKQIKEIHRIVKPQHRLKPKNYANKQNKEPRSTFEYRQQKYSQISRMGQTQAFDDEKQKSYNRYDTAFVCHEKLLINEQIVHKIKRKIKNFSQDMPISSSFQLLSEISSSKHVKSVKYLTPAQQIAEFQKSTQNLQSQFQSETLKQLFLKEKSYFLTQNFNCYLQRKQPNVTWLQRSIVINWMMEFSQNFGCRREALAIAVNILDRYLSLADPIKLQQLQKIACASMYISNKVDGMSFNLNNLCDYMENISIKQIQKLQVDISIRLQWKLNPPTGNMWANRIALQWDMYLDHQINNLSPTIKDNINMIKFKTQDPEGYNNYRTLMQYIDLALMDVHSLRYHSREMAASFIYLILIIRLKFYEINEIIEKFPIKSDYIIKDSQLNEFYSDYLLNSFGFTLQDLLPTVQFCSTFLVLPLCFKLPAIVQQNTDECDLTFEALCMFQTCNESNLIALRKRDRQFD